MYGSLCVDIVYLCSGMTSLRMVATNIRPSTVDWFMMKIKVEAIVIVTLL